MRASAAKIKNGENISFYISVQCVCNVSLNQWLYQSLLFLPFASYQKKMEGEREENEIERNIWWFFIRSNWWYCSYSCLLHIKSDTLDARRSNVNMISRREFRVVQYILQKEKLNRMSWYTMYRFVNIIKAVEEGAFVVNGMPEADTFYTCMYWEITCIECNTLLSYSCGYGIVHGTTWTCF